LRVRVADEAIHLSSNKEADAVLKKLLRFGASGTFPCRLSATDANFSGARNRQKFFAELFFKKATASFTLGKHQIL